jgi:hypothetical protein
MRRGSVALMGLDVAGYSDCLPFNAEGSASWNGIFPNQDVENLVSNDLQNGNYINVDTSNLVSGTIYSARVQCTETSTGLIRYDYVKFKVTSSKLNEF